MVSDQTFSRCKGLDQQNMIFLTFFWPKNFHQTWACLVKFQPNILMVTQVLVHKVFFYLLLHTRRCGKEGLCNLRRDSFEIKTSENGTKFVENTFNEPTKKNQGRDTLTTSDILHNNHAIIKEQHGSDLCPVSSFEHYLNNTRKDIIDFFQKPNKNRDGYDKMWLRKNTLAEMIKIISHKAKLLKIYTHQIRKMTATAFNKSGFTLKQIANVTKHKNLQSLQNYIGGPDQEEKESSNAFFDYGQKKKKQK